MSSPSSTAIQIVLLSVISLLPSDSFCQQRDPLDGLDAYIQKSMTEWQVPGLAIAIVKDDSVVFMRGYGVREAGEDARVDAHTVFAIGSNTKAFTAAAVAMLVDEGKVSWDDPVVKHLPWFQLPDPWVTQQVTIRDLLAHRVAGDAGRSTGRLYYWPTFFNREEVLRRLRLLEIGSPRFRSGFVYCNECYMAAAEIVAAVSRTSWEEFVKVRIFEPLQMSSTTVSAYELWDAQNVRPCWICVLRTRTVEMEDARIENIAMPHVSSEGEPHPIEWMTDSASAPAGGLNASAEDLAKWMRLLLESGVYEGERLLSEAVVNDMFSAQVITQPPVWYFPMQYGAGGVAGHFWAYGFGWRSTDYRGERLVMHGGGTLGQASSITLMPRQRLGVAVLTNKDAALAWALPFRVLDAYLGAPDEDWSSALLNGFRYWEAQQQAQEEKRAAERVQETTPPLPLESCVGTYAHPAFGDLEIEERNGGLVLKLSDEFSWPVEHLSHDEFRVEFHDGSQPNPESLTFEVASDGNVTGLVLGGQKYERVREERRPRW